MASGRREFMKKEKRNWRRPTLQRPTANPWLSNLPKGVHGEHVDAGWPSWLLDIAGDALDGWIPRRASDFEMISKIGKGTYSNVYKARDSLTGKIVALKKVCFNNSNIESVKFMAREIVILHSLNHPNVVKLEGLAISRMSNGLYLVFEYMEHDLAGLVANPKIKFTQSQVKCYMHQLLSGLEYCHGRDVLHRDIKGSNILIQDDGLLKIADFGLASFFDPNSQQPMTSQVVTLWYRAPELLLGATEYGVGIDLWSAGCILAELFARRPIMCGSTEMDQLHKIFKLCGSPSEEYWNSPKFQFSNLYKPQHPYTRCMEAKFRDFPPSSWPLIATLLAIDPDERQTASAALSSDFFTTKPYACEPSSLPKYLPSKEMDAKLRDTKLRDAKLRIEETRSFRTNDDGSKKNFTHNRALSAIHAPKANAKLQTNIEGLYPISMANARSNSEKFPPPHQDGAAVGSSFGSSYQMDPPNDGPSSTSTFESPEGHVSSWYGPLLGAFTIGRLLRRMNCSACDDALPSGLPKTQNIKRSASVKERSPADAYKPHYEISFPHARLL